MIINKNLGKYLIQALDILKLTSEIKEHKIPHITRGSCGNRFSLLSVGYQSRGSIKYDISFARFLNECRDNLPDIDFDFPYNTRDAIFIKSCNVSGLEKLPESVIMYTIMKNQLSVKLLESWCKRIHCKRRYLQN